MTGATQLLTEHFVLPALQVDNEMRAANELKQVASSKVLLVLPIGVEQEDNQLGAAYLYPWAGVSLEQMIDSEEYTQLTHEQRVLIGTWLLVCLMQALEMLAEKVRQAEGGLGHVCNSCGMLLLLLCTYQLVRVTSGTLYASKSSTALACLFCFLQSDVAH